MIGTLVGDAGTAAAGTMGSCVSDRGDRPSHAGSAASTAVAGDGSDGGSTGLSLSTAPAARVCDDRDRPGGNRNRPRPAAGLLVSAGSHRSLRVRTAAI